MAHIKKIVMNGFKSFARKTEIPFDKGINVILGPNGSGKSNISDALCFVLGRLSIKSMRAAKARNLLFMGSKFIKPSHEASVELVFDNADRVFGIDRDEITLKRIVRRNGQSVYKINDEARTRAEIIEALAQAGIDPHGFNIVLQGQIQSIVRTPPEDRRKIIEEVAGIAIYESRKEKSLKELEKTEQRLKEISTILRERTAYLKNLENERANALKFKELETTVKRAKASIVNKKIEEKKKEISVLAKSIEEKSKQKEKIRERVENIQRELEALSEKISQINKHIQKATGVEQEELHSYVANLKIDLGGLRVRRENYENRKAEVEKRIVEMSKSIPELEQEIKELKKKSPLTNKKSNELKKKKDELAELEEERKRLLTFKTELNALKDRVKDKERQLARVNAESESLVKQIEESSQKLTYRNDEECSGDIENLRKTLGEKRQSIDGAGKKELDNERIISVSEAEIKRVEKIKSDVEKIDVCPLCQSKITEDHKNHVFVESNSIIKEAGEKLERAQKELERIKSSKEGMIVEARQLQQKISSAEIELHKHRTIKEKKEQLKKFVSDDQALKGEIKSLEDKRNSL